MNLWQDLDKARQLQNEQFALWSLAERRVEVLDQLYKIRQSFADHTRALPNLRRSLNQTKSIDTATIENLNKLMLATFAGENVYKEESGGSF